MITCIVIDDEEMSRLAMEQLVKSVSSLSLKGSFPSALSAREFLQDNAIDLIIVDVEMPSLTGLEFVQTLNNKPEVIIASSKEKYALDAFDVDVTDYLLKPVSMGRFLKSIAKVEAKIKSHSIAEVKNDYVFIKSNNQLVNLRLSDVQYIEAYGDYVNIHTEKDRYIVHGTMKAFESKLNNNFLRVHRSFIVQLNRIQLIEDTLITIGKKLIPIGDSYRQELNNRLQLL